jgi:hypothetical protein
VSVPTDTRLGELYWEKLLQTCRDLRQFIVQNEGGLSSTGSTSSKQAEQCMSYYSLDGESCLRILKAKEGSSTGRAVEEMSRLAMELRTKQAEVDRLNNELRACLNKELRACTLPQPAGECRQVVATNAVQQ